MDERAAIFTPSTWTLTGGLIVSGVIVQIIVSTQQLLTPVDISGTLFGGATGTVEHAALWILAMAGVMMAALLRLPGSRLAWIVGGGAPILFGALVLWSYPDDAGGNLIFSPQRSEIALMMALGAAFLILGLILRRYLIPAQPFTNRLRLLRKTLRMAAMAVMAALFIGLPIFRQMEKGQTPLEPCAHDAMGKQLTVCLQPYDPTAEPPK